jgi:hypothetical protein
MIYLGIWKQCDSGSAERAVRIFLDPLQSTKLASPSTHCTKAWIRWLPPLSFMSLTMTSRFGQPSRDC